MREPLQLAVARNRAGLAPSHDVHSLVHGDGTPRRIEDGNYHYVDIGILREGHNKADAETARYAFAQEFGWGPDHPAQPYIRPTMDEDSREARKVMKQTFKQALGMETE